MKKISDTKEGRELLAEGERILPTEIYEGVWGLLRTYKEKREFLDTWKKMNDE